LCVPTIDSVSSISIKLDGISYLFIIEFTYSGKSGFCACSREEFEEIGTTALFCDIIIYNMF